MKRCVVYDDVLESTPAFSERRRSPCLRVSVFAGALADVHHWFSRLFVAHRIFGPVHLGRSGGGRLQQPTPAGIGLLEQAGSYFCQKLDDERDYHPRSKINIEDFTIINKSLSLEANHSP